MTTRPKGYGFSAEAKRKIESKYDGEQESKAREWIEAVLEENVFEGKEGLDQVHQVLRSGTVLCRVANKLGGNIKIHDSKLAFKQMENIGNFLKFMEGYGCARCDLFQTVDLYEKQNMPSVIDGVHALGRKANLKNPHLPQLGPKEAEANPRSFTDEQLRARQAIHMP
ncbi:myophilin [Exaiptasia diaphana]|uniref:Calponin-homology (CH) domain-containing protein n=1 Tax=Exaiptasia diaphana TaxID=2652724 RepID=A0A913WXR1_EXADI|nr:myophilin [Exaiptasia diaphana]